MRTQQLQIDLSGITELIDTTGVNLDIDLPDGVELRRCEPTEISDVGPATALMVLTGPNSPIHSSRADVDRLLRSLRAGGRAILLLGWTAEDLPGHWLLDVLQERGCQIAQIVHPEADSLGGIETSLLVTRVVEPSPGLAAANLFAVAELGISRLKRQTAELSGQLNRVRKNLTTTQATVNGLNSSGRFRAAQALIDGVHSPIRGVVTVPRDLSRIWRDRRSDAVKRKAAMNGSVAVPIALPSSGAAADRPRLITLRAPATLIVPRNLAGHGLVGYEPSSLACFLAATDVAGPGAVFDIGANIGIYAALASAMTDRTVCAFEPWPVLVEVARQFSDDNKLGFTTEAIALGAENGNAAFYLSDSSDSSNSLNAGFRTSSHQIQVPVETLDSYVDRTGTAPAVLKVDTETTEPDVLAGATGTIAKHRPWILCEVLADRVESDLERVLAPLGYRWYHVTEEMPFREAVRIVGDGSCKDMMWLFAPDKPTGAFWSALRERWEALSACTAERGRQLQAAA
jgi:FkbM family methyltransferase